MSRPAWNERCDRISFVSGWHRCDRKAGPNGRCPKHSESQHDNAEHYIEARKHYVPKSKRVKP